MLGSALGVLGSMDVVAMGQVRVVSSRFVVAIQMVFGGFAMVACSVLMVLRCLRVMMSCFV